MNREPYRIAPLMPATAYKTYQIRMPLSTHWVDVTCEDFECGAYLHGWVTTIDERTDLGRKQAHYIRNMAGRSFKESRSGLGLVEFEFRPGQPCFAKHKVRGDRPEVFIVRDGDFRGNPRGTPARVHKNGREWVEDFSEHLDTINTEIEKG